MNREIIINFPYQCDLDYILQLDIIDKLEKSFLQKNISIVFNCENIEFIRPSIVNLISANLYHHLINKNDVLIKLPKNIAVKRYLEDIGFFKEFRVDGEKVYQNLRSTSVALKRLTCYEGTYLESIVYWLSKNANIPIKSAQDFVSINLVEAINNVFDHSNSEIGCYISAQAYHKENRVILSVLDMGIGFYNSLKSFYNDIKNDVEAINKAVTEGISSKRFSENRVRGLGLSNISGFLKGRGELTIVSHQGFWRQKRDGKTIAKELPYKFLGTCLNIDIEKFSIYDIICDKEDVWE